MEKLISNIINKPIKLHYLNFFSPLLIIPYYCLKDMWYLNQYTDYVKVEAYNIENYDKIILK